MKLIFSYLILGLIGVALVTPAFADQYYRGEDFSVRENPDGSMTRTLGLPPWIYDGENFAPQIVNEFDTHIKVESATSSFIYDKDSCSISIYAPGRIGEPIYDDEGNVTGYSNSEPIIQSESWSTKKADVGSDVWKDVSWNDAKCVTNVIKNSTGIFISGKHETLDGWTEIIYSKPIDSLLETFTTIKNNNLFDTSKYGTDQVVILGDDVAKTVNEASNQITFEKDGQTIFMDYSQAEKELWVVNENIDSVHLDYKNPEAPLSFGETQTLDPTWGTSTGTLDDARTNLGITTSCTFSIEMKRNDLSSAGLLKPASANDSHCIIDDMRFDIGGLPRAIDVTDTVLGYRVQGTTNGINCDYVDVTVDPTTATASELYDAIYSGTAYVSNDSTCASDGTKTEDLGTTADANIEAAALAQDNQFVVGLRFTDMVRDASSHAFTLDLPTIAITYTINSPDPPKLVNATLSASAPYSVTVNWSTPEGNGGGTPTSAFIYRYNGVGYDLIDSVSMSTHTYSDTNPRQSDTGSYRVYGASSAGSSEPQFAMSNTMTTGLRSHWPMISTTNDNGREDNDGTVTGTESYTSTGIYLNGNSYVPIPNESDYDFLNRTAAWSVVFTMADSNSTAANQVIFAKGNTLLTGGFYVYLNTAHNLLLSLSNTTTTNELRINSGLGAVNDGVEHQYFLTKAAGTGAASEVKWYRDGTVTAYTTSANTLTNPAVNNVALTIGAESDAGLKSNLSVGQIMFFNYELSSDEVAAIYGQYIATLDDMAYGTYTLTNDGTLGDTPKLVTYLNVTAGFPDDISVTETIFANNTDIDQTITTETVPFEWTETYWPQITLPDTTYNYEAQINLDNGFEIEDETSNTVSSEQEFDPSYLPAMDNPSVQGNVNYTISRSDDSDTIYLGVNREGGTLTRTWNIECITQNNLQASQSKDPNTSWEGTWTNLTNVGYFNSSWTGFANSQGYVTCFNEDRLFTGISYTNSSLALLGIQLFDESYGSMLGVPVGIFFIVITAGMANKRTAPTWIIVLAAIAGMMAVIGFFTLSPIVWGVALVAAMLGVFVNQKVF